jgi:hypothetical protein
VKLIIVLRSVSIVWARGIDNCAVEYIYYRARAIDRFAGIYINKLQVSYTFHKLTMYFTIV